MKVKVLRTDIQDGRQGSPKSCPIALALFRARFNKEAPHLQVGQLVDVGNWGVVVRRDMGGMDIRVERAELPIEARQFVADFDCGLVVQPFEFELDLRPTER